MAVVYAIYLIATDFGRFSRSSQVVFSRDNWWVLVAAWLGLKIVHETAHAVACRKFGGTVTQAGVFLLLLVPVPYVDVTSAWRFADKWQRIIVAAAGMYVEFFVAAVATFVWANAESAETCSVAQSVIAMAAIGTLLFNGNPLMRFDGYYILSDWLEIPNLAGRGNQYLIGLAERLAFGTRRTPNLAPRERRIVAAYAVLSLAWRLFAYTTLLLAFGALVARWHVLAGYAAVGAFVVWFAYRGVKAVWRHGCGGSTGLAAAAGRGFCRRPGHRRRFAGVDVQPRGDSRPRNRGICAAGRRARRRGGFCRGASGNRR